MTKTIFYIQFILFEKPTSGSSIYRYSFFMNAREKAATLRRTVLDTKQTQTTTVANGSRSISLRTERTQQTTKACLLQKTPMGQCV